MKYVIDIWLIYLYIYEQVWWKWKYFPEGGNCIKKTVEIFRTIHEPAENSIYFFTCVSYHDQKVWIRLRIFYCCVHPWTNLEKDVSQSMYDQKVWICVQISKCLLSVSANFHKEIPKNLLSTWAVISCFHE